MTAALVILGVVALAQALALCLGFRHVIQLERSIASERAAHAIPQLTYAEHVPAATLAATLEQFEKSTELVVRTMAEAFMPAPIDPGGEGQPGAYDVPEFREDGRDITDIMLPMPAPQRTFAPAAGGDDFGVHIATPPIGAAS